MLDENIHLAEYDPLWKRRFEDESRQITEVFCGVQVCIEHIGSTAVMGLISKPIIDILLGITSIDILPVIKDGLLFLKYEYLGEAGITGRYYFRKRVGQAFNVHVVLIESDLWNNNLLVRDYLIENEGAAREYAAVKLDALKKGITTMLAYSDYKFDFVRTLLNKAKEQKGL